MWCAGSGGVWVVLVKCQFSVLVWSKPFPNQVEQHVILVMQVMLVMNFFKLKQILLEI